MRYEINVALNGNHFFATANRSITDSNKLKEVLNAFRKSFKSSEGYTMSVTRWEDVGHYVDIDSLFITEDSNQLPPPPKEIYLIV